MSRSGNVWDNATMESFFSSLKTERTARKMYQTRDEPELMGSTTLSASTFQTPALHDWISEPCGVRDAGRTSLSGCQRNRVQARYWRSPTLTLLTSMRNRRPAGLSKEHSLSIGGGSTYISC